MRHTVGVAEMRIAVEPGDVLVTHALGSCLGLAVYDPVAQVGDLLHIMMPQGSINPAKAEANPYMFEDTGEPEFYRELYSVGAVKGRLSVKVAGGANVHNDGSDHFNIGKRNYIVLRKLFWKNGILITAEEVGGAIARTMYLEIGSGRVWISTAGQEREL